MKKNKKKDEMWVRSSAAEYLTYVAAVGDDKDSIEVRYEDENIWLTQKMLATVYGVELNTINYHIKKIYEDKELEEESTIRNFRIVQKEGNRDVTRNVAQEWTSSEEVYEINAKLIAGKKYTIEELEAPAGYEKAEKTEFTVSEDGTEDVIKVVDNKIIVEEKEEEKQEEPKSIRTGDMIAVAFGVISIYAISLVAMILFKKRIK